MGHFHTCRQFDKMAPKTGTSYYISLAVGTMVNFGYKFGTERHKLEDLSNIFPGLNK